MPGKDQVSDESLNALAELCIAARLIIDTRNAPVMRSLIDMLLLEVGVAIAAEDCRHTESVDAKQR